MVTGRMGIVRGPFDLYDFVNDADRAMFNQRGLLPWWADAHLKIRFYRPLPSALRWLDLHALGTHIRLMHVHSLFWWALMVVLAAGLFRRLLTPRAALVATIILALGPWNVIPLAWLANREVLMTLVFGIVALRCSLRGGVFLVGAFVAYVAAFSCGEYSFCLGGYALALALLGAPRPARTRVLELATFVGPAVGYLAIRAARGYGTFASSFYADPLREPGKLLWLSPARIVKLLAQSWLTLGTDPWSASAPMWAICAGVAVLLVLFVLGARRLWPELDASQRRTVGWLLLGSLAAMLPVLAAAPSVRLLAVSAFGMAAVVATFLDECWSPKDPTLRRRPELVGLVATVLAFTQLVHGPIASLLCGIGLRRSAHISDDASRALAKRIDEEHPAEVDVVRGGGQAFFGPFALSLYCLPGELPPWHILSQSPHVLALIREANVIELKAAERVPLIPGGRDNLYRDTSRGYRPGDTIERTGLRVEILEVGSEGPTRARYTFARPLDSKAHLWLDERTGGLSPAALPPVGFGAPFDP
ncbi:MAG: hypothetical protein ABI321_02415 [Polyangia bacterium]